MAMEGADRDGQGTGASLLQESGLSGLALLMFPKSPSLESFWILRKQNENRKKS